MELMLNILDERETIQINVQPHPLLQDVCMSNVNFKFNKKLKRLINVCDRFSYDGVVAHLLEARSDPRD